MEELNTNTYFFLLLSVLQQQDYEQEFLQRRFSGGSQSYGGDSPRLSPCSSMGKLSKSDEQLSSMEQDSGQCSRNTSCETLGEGNRSAHSRLYPRKAFKCRSLNIFDGADCFDMDSVQLRAGFDRACVVFTCTQSMQTYIFISAVNKYEYHRFSQPRPLCKGIL